MKYILAALLLFVSLAHAAPADPFWTFTPATDMRLAAQKLNAVTVAESRSADGMFATVPWNPGASTLNGYLFHLYANDGSISGDTTSTPHMMFEVPTGVMEDYSLEFGSPGVVLMIPFTPDTVIAFERTVSFIVTARFYSSLGGSTDLSTVAEYTNFDWEGPNPVGNFYSAGAYLPGVSEYGGFLAVSVARDDRDSFPGDVGVPFYSIWYILPLESNVEVVAAPK